MVDVFRDVEVASPGTLKVGSRTEATAIAEILHGQVSITFASLATNVGASGSAAVAGLETAHRVLVVPAGATALGVVGAACLAAGVLTVTGVNISAGTVVEGAKSFNFFAFR